MTKQEPHRRHHHHPTHSHTHRPIDPKAVPSTR
jgi:hypothetical protein